MIVGTATGPSWAEQIARLAAPHVPEEGFTVVMWDGDKNVVVRKTYATRAAAHGQATKIGGGDDGKSNVYVLTKRDGRVTVWNGPISRIARVNI